MLRRLYPYWRPAARATLAGLALLTAAGVLELLLPWPVKWLVDSVFGSQPAPAWMRAVGITAPGSVDRGTAVLLVAAAVFVLGTVHKVTFMTSHYLLIGAGLRLVRTLRCATADHLHRLSVRYHDRSKVGDLVYRALYDTYAAQALLSQVVAPVATGALVLAGILVVMARVDLVLTAIVAVTIPAISLTVWAFGRRLERVSRTYHERESSLYSIVQESLVSIRAVQAFAQEPGVSRRVADGTGQSEAANRRLALTQLAFSASVGILMAAGTAAAVYAGAVRAGHGKLSVGDVLVFLSYLGMLYTPISAFAQSSGQLQSARTQLRRVFEVLDTVPDILDKPTATTLAHVRGDVEFRDVTFEYDAGRPVLRRVNLHLPAGQVIAVVGRTGSGKSTLASLLLRLADPTAGGVFLDHHDLRDLRLAWLRGQVAIVSQEPVLFSGTIAENIEFGRTGATRDEITAAARLAHAHEFIAELPAGYETLLGERGVNLSGGQRQRLSLARAFLKNAPVLVLDEPTSALDAHTEQMIVSSLHGLLRGRTALVIAHRLSTIRAADRIVVIDHGQIVEQGTHAELLAAQGAYAELWSQQFKDTSANGSELQLHDALA